MRHFLAPHFEERAEPTVHHLLHTTTLSPNHHSCYESALDNGIQALQTEVARLAPPPSAPPPAGRPRYDHVGRWNRQRSGWPLLAGLADWSR